MAPFCAPVGLGGVVRVPSVEDEPHCSHRDAARVLTYTAHIMGAIAIDAFGEAPA